MYARVELLLLKSVDGDMSCDRCQMQTIASRYHVRFSAHEGSLDQKLVLQARRAALLERETGLQRWAIRLELESSRQAAAAKTLQQQLQKVRHVCKCRVTADGSSTGSCLCTPLQGAQTLEVDARQSPHSMCGHMTAVIICHSKLARHAFGPSW